MRRIKKYLSIYLSIFILIPFICLPLKVNAIGGYFTTDSFSYSDSGFQIGDNNFGYFYMEDDSNLPDTFHIYYKVEDGKAECLLLSEITPQLINKIGLTMSTQYLSLVTTYIQNVIKGDVTIPAYAIADFLNNYRPVLKNNIIVGIALNNLAGCKMVYATPNDKVDIPSDLVNEIYDITNYYIINVNPITIDFFNVELLDYNKATDFLSGNNETYENTLSVLNTDGIKFSFASNGYFYTSNYSGYKNSYAYFENEGCYVCDSFDSVVRDYDLNENDYTLNIDDFIGNYTVISANCYDVTSGSVMNLTRLNVYGNGGSGPSYTTVYVYVDSTFAYKKDGGYITLYRQVNIPQQITNNTYSKEYYISTNYIDYNTSNNNSYTTTVSNVQNSSNVNNQIYNQSKTTTNNTTTNNNYNENTTTNNTNITNIINNYYGDDDDDDDGGDDDDDSIWQALIKAIAEFFKKIGEFLAAILTGIVELFTEIIGAITDITTNMTALTDFLSSIFSWLPTEIVAVITLGFSLGVFICLIKLFK